MNLLFKNGISTFNTLLYHSLRLLFLSFVLLTNRLNHKFLVTPMSPQQSWLASILQYLMDIFLISSWGFKENIGNLGRKYG